MKQNLHTKRQISRFNFDLSFRHVRGRIFEKSISEKLSRIESTTKDVLIDRTRFGHFKVQKRVWTQTGHCFTESVFFVFFKKNCFGSGFLINSIPIGMTWNFNHILYTHEYMSRKIFILISQNLVYKISYWKLLKIRHIKHMVNFIKINSKYQGM